MVQFFDTMRMIKIIMLSDMSCNYERFCNEFGWPIDNVLLQVCAHERGVISTRFCPVAHER